MDLMVEYTIILLGEMSILATIIAVLITSTRCFTEILDRNFTYRNQIIFILIFGAFSVLGTYGGQELPSGAIVNIRDLGPIAAGLIGGPVIGLGAGLIGGIHRYFLGGFVAIPCGLATVIAGLGAGIIYRWKKGVFIGVYGATLFAIFIECLHMGLVLVISRPFNEAFQLVSLVIMPMILANALGIAIFALIVSSKIKEKEKVEEKDRLIRDLIQENKNLRVGIPLEDE